MHKFQMFELILHTTQAQPRPKQCNFTAKFTITFTLYVRKDNLMFEN